MGSDVEVEQADEVVELAYKLMRALGCSSPEEALKIAVGFAVKLNPYLLYRGVKTPSQLINYFEGQIEELKKELEELKRKLEEERNKGENELATRLGINYLLAKTAYEVLREGQRLLWHPGRLHKRARNNLPPSTCKNIWN